MLTEKPKLYLSQLFDYKIKNDDSQSRIFEPLVKSKWSSFVAGIKAFVAPFENKSALSYLQPVVEGLCAAFSVAPLTAVLLLHAGINVCFSALKVVFLSISCLLTVLSVCLLHVLNGLLNSLVALFKTLFDLPTAFKFIPGVFQTVQHSLSILCSYAVRLFKSHLTEKENEELAAAQKNLANAINDVACIKHLFFPYFWYCHYQGTSFKPANVENIWQLHATAKTSLSTAVACLFYDALFVTNILFGAAFDEAVAILTVVSAPIAVIRNELFQRCIGFGTSLQIGVVFNSVDMDLAKTLCNAKKAGVRIIGVCSDSDNVVDSPLFDKTHLASLSNQDVVIMLNDVKFQHESKKGATIVRVMDKDAATGTISSTNEDTTVHLLKNCQAGIFLDGGNEEIAQYLLENLLGRMACRAKSIQTNAILACDASGGLSAFLNN